MSFANEKPPYIDELSMRLEEMGKYLRQKSIQIKLDATKVPVRGQGARHGRVMKDVLANIDQAALLLSKAQGHLDGLRKTRK